ncbi:MAG: hypothetical protein IPO97_12040 [Sphingomonadales bacterium]|nr:hypothetical protein [Sphingomonadales bacterium]
MTDIAAAWRDFCTRLADAGDIILAPDVPDDSLIRAEGFRYLSRLTKLALEQYVEASDPDFPFFYKLSHETAKIGADNPDNVYWNASIRGDCDYRITGKRGSMFYFSIVANAMRYHIDGSAHATGQLLDSDIAWGPDGELEIIASCTPRPTNWLRLEPDASVIVLRQSALDRGRERGGEFKIERIGGPAVPAPLSPERLAAGLSTSAQFVRGIASTFADWTRLFREHPNQFVAMDQSMFQKGGGAKDIYYAHAYWRIAPDEAWVIEANPPDCDYWNFQLDNWWMESFDYRFRQITVNKHSARLEADGGVRIICAARDPGVGNWIDTCGHNEGTALLRWAGANVHPLPNARVVKLEEL